VRESTGQFAGSAQVRGSVDPTDDQLAVSIDQVLPFKDQASALLSHFLARDLGDFSMWWYGQTGQVRSNMLVCKGLPSADSYTRLLTLEEPPPPPDREMDYVDQIIAGDV